MPPGTMPRLFSLAEISGVFTKAVTSFLIASMIAVVIVLVVTSIDVNVDKVGAMFSGMVTRL